MDQHKQQLDWVEINCKSFWTLFNIAEPIIGGYAYFNAALASKFTMMFIIDGENKIHGPKPTDLWLRQFNPETGWINTEFNADAASWFFCQKYP